ncbi:PIN domain-containing protein [Pseudoalteromonas prydzensis]|uniref:PIN domain-containing protein n=1 Tax=Pseudoalteromonas prydzensis TaxID=182141 RepID=UPI0024BD3DCB|nr:PIN domain-containing protein [Pseudoalteromonas prydzensis]
MSSDENEEYGAILVDTSIFDAHGLKLEKGLLGKLRQFKDSDIDYLLPDVIKGEVKSHLEKKVKSARASLEKALNDAGDHLFFEGSELNDAKSILIDSNEIEGIAESRVDKFIANSGALVLECGDYVSVSELLQQYFKNEPPLAETGKKKNEFPDAIVLLATEAWAQKNDIRVLAVARDGDWKNYCENSDNIDYTEDFADALSKFNKATAPFSFLSLLIEKLEEEDDDAADFIEKIHNGVANYFDGFTPDQEADSFHYWEPDGCHGRLNDFELADKNFKIVDHAEDYIVLEVSANITVEVEGEFSLSQYDSIDRDHVYIGGVTVTVEEEFTSEILVTVYGDLTGPLSDLDVEDIEVVNPITSVDFGTLEPDYGDYD